MGDLTLDCGKTEGDMMEPPDQQMERGKALLNRKMEGRHILWRPKKRQPKQYLKITEATAQDKVGLASLSF